MKIAISIIFFIYCPVVILFIYIYTVCKDPGRGFLRPVLTLMNRTGKTFEKIFRVHYLNKIKSKIEFIYTNGNIYLDYRAVLGSKVTLFIISFIPGVLTGKKFLIVILSGLLTGMAGFFLPDLLLNFKYRAKTRRIDTNLPYLMDLLYISTLSGQSIYSSIQILVENYDSGICGIFLKFLQSIKFGIGKKNAYENLISKNKTKKFKNFILLLMQAEKYGSAISDILKEKSEYMKYENRDEIEKRSRKQTIFILFPVAVFILPAFILLVGGPLIFTMGADFYNF